MYKRLGPYKFPQLIYGPDPKEEIYTTNQGIKVVAIFGIYAYINNLARTYPASDLLFGIKVTQHGQMREGRFHKSGLYPLGHSRFIYDDGKWAIGSFENKQFNGYGSVCFKNNECINGIFQDDMLHGKGILESYFICIYII